MVLSNRKRNSKWGRSFRVYSNATQQNKLKHIDKKRNKKRDGTNGNEETSQENREGLTKMEECLFYRKQYGSKFCMSHGKLKDAGSDGPMCSHGGAVKKHRETKETKLGCAAQERNDDVQAASGVKGVRI